MQIQPMQNLKMQSNQFTGRHLPKDFSSMMNYVYKNAPDSFEFQNSIRVSTVLDNGKEVSGTANFLHGKFKGLQLDEGFEHLSKEFKSTALKHFLKRMAKPELQKKLGYIK